MSVWVSALLSVSLLYATVRLALLYRQYQKTPHVCWALTSFVYMLSSLSWLVGQFAVSQETALLLRQGMEWVHVTAISFSLCTLALENWYDRPGIARYPFWLNAMPLLLLLSYLMVYDTLHLKSILAGIYEGGALLIGLLIFGLFTVRNLNYLYAFAGMLMFLLSFIIFWFPGGPAVEAGWLWKIFAVAGVLSFISGYIYAQAGQIEEELSAGSEFVSSPSS